MKKITVIIVEDHNLIRKALSLIVNNDSRFEVIAEAANGEDAIELSMVHQPDIVLMDINLPGINGIDATRVILKICPAIKVVAMTMHTQAYSVERMMEAGASGYVSKNVSHEELYKCITNVVNGDKFFSAEIKEIVLNKIMNVSSPVPGLKKLSRREIEIAKFIKKGESSKQIATSLCIATKTVEVHRYNILRKLKAKNSIALVQYLNENPYLLDKMIV
jgi:DNA-binding NarL/FixJ family response regulator